MKILIFIIMGLFSSLGNALGGIWSGVGSAASAFGSVYSAVDPLTGAAISAGGNLVGGIGDNILASNRSDDMNAFNAQQAALNRQFQREERLATQEWNEEMWNKNNEYNSMASQVERARAAGVNPNALFAKGGGNVPSSPVTSTPMSGSQASVGSDISGEILLANAQRRALDAKANLDNTAAEGQKLNNKWTESTMELRTQALQKTISVMDADETLKKATAGMNEEQAKYLKESTSWLGRKNDAEIKQIFEQCNVLRNEVLEIEQRIAESKARIGNLGYQNALLKQQTLTEKERTEFVDQQTNESIWNVFQTQANTELVELYAALRKKEVEFSNMTGIPYGLNEFDANWYLLKQGRFVDYYGRIYSRSVEMIGQEAVNTAGDVAGAYVTRGISLLDGKDKKAAYSLPKNPFTQPSYSNTFLSQPSYFNP